MNPIRLRIAASAAAPALGVVALLGPFVGVTVRADRLADVDRMLAARGEAIARSVEYDGGWEVEPVPEHLTADLVGWDVSAGGERLIGPPSR